MFWLIASGVTLIVLAVVALVLKEVLGIRHIATDKVGIVEKLWSAKGSVPEGQIIARNGEAGLQVDIKRGGLHFGLQRWQYSLHKVPLVTVPQGKIAYIYARDGEGLAPSQTLARVMECNNFQDARAFLGESYDEQGNLIKAVSKGQRGRQRAILREGVYAINLGLFVVIAEDRVYSLASSKDEAKMLDGWQKELRDSGGFNPIVIGGSGESDNIGIVTVQDGPPLATGEIIAPDVPNHNNFQDPEAFITNKGQRGRQISVLTDGTYFINRWFASVEKQSKTVVPIGSVGVVISYYGKKGKDQSGDKFRHGEQVAEGERGVWAKPLSPGKYAFNRYAAEVVGVPTTNFVLHWITGTASSHKFDETLRSIDIVTKDAYEPTLPLSLVVHIDYEKAPGVVQRFGDVKRLITQTIDPMLSAYFRDSCQNRTMLELFQNRDAIQQDARVQMSKRFEEFDIELVDVLIGKPDTDQKDGKIETLLEQLRQRQLSKEQIETYQHQRAASEEQKKLNEAQAITAKQSELTNSNIAIEIAKNAGSAKLAEAEMKKRQTVVEAEAELERQKRLADAKVVQANADGQTLVINAKAEAEQVLLAAEAKSKQEILLGKGEGTRVMQVGLAEATALQRKIAAFGDPRYYALIEAAGHLATSDQPLVPERVFMNGGDGKEPSSNPMSMLLNLLLAQTTGFSPNKPEENPKLTSMIARLTNDAIDGMGVSVPTDQPRPVDSVVKN